jgi:hypothetical protein
MCGGVKSEVGSPLELAERGLDWERGYDSRGRKWHIDLYPIIEHFACNWMNLGTPDSYRDDFQDATLCWIKTPSSRGAAAVRHVILSCEDQ